MSRPSGSAARRPPAPSGRAAARGSADGPASSRLRDDGPALLPHELRDVVRPAPTLATRPRSLPPGEWLRPRPGARGGARPLIRVANARLDLVEEALDLLGPGRKDARREPVLRLVGLGDGLVEPRHLADREQRHEHLLEEQRRRERQLDDGRRHVVAAVEHAPRQPGAAEQRSEEHTSELQSLAYLVCRLLLEK